MNNIFGKKLGRYVLLDVIGAGGMATVYNAFDSRDEKNVALKVILPSKRSSEVFIQQFEKEARALASLNHTNIVKVLDYGSEDEQPYLVMDYIQGGTLKDAMKEAFSWDKAAAILAPIARALAYVHRQEIIHRDVKPSNILIDDNYNSLLSDFGIVKLIESKDDMENTAIGVGVGTPDYMSPEQGMGKTIDFRADIYSLGLVFYEMVTGQKAYNADSPMAVVIKHVTEEIKNPSLLNRNIPIYVEEAILKAIQKDPGRRYKSMDEFADVLEMIALGEKAPQKRILKKLGYKKKLLKPILVSFAILFSVIFLVYFLLSYYSVFQKNNIPIYSLYELGTLVSVEATLTPTAPLTTSHIVGNLETEVIKNTITPILESTKIPEPTQTPTPQITSKPLPTQKPTELSPKFLGTPFVNQYNSTSFREIAKWGIGGGNEVEWSLDGSKIGVATTNGVYIYNTSDKKLIRFINTEQIPTTFSFNHSGAVVAIGTNLGDVSLWNINTGELIEEMSMVKPTAMRDLENDSPVHAVEFASDDSFLVISYENGVINGAEIDGKNLFAVEQYPKAYDLEISQDQKFIYAANGNGTIFKWDIEKKIKSKEFNNPSAVEEINLSNDGKYLVASGSQNAVYLWNLIEERMIYSFTNLGSPAGDADFSSDNQFLIIGLKNGEIKVYRVPSVDEYFGMVSEFASIDGYQDEIKSLAFSPDLNQFASSSWDNSLVIWDFNTLEEIYHHDFSMKKINTMYFSPTGDWLVTAHEGNIVRAWDVDKAALLYEFEGYLPKGYPFSPDGKFLAIGSPTLNNNQLDQLKIYDRETGNLITNLPLMKSTYLVQFSKNSQILATGAIRELILWDVLNWEKIKLSGGVTQGCGQYFTPQNELLALISEAGIYFEINPQIIEMCGFKPLGAFLKFYFQDEHKMVFVLGDGRVWAWDFKSAYSSIHMETTIKDSDEFFIAGDEESGYFAVSNGESLFIKAGVRNAIQKTFPYQDYYKYRAAFNDEKGIFALGSQFGDIQIWTMP